jgi:hypothetical protein
MNGKVQEPANMQTEAYQAKSKLQQINSNFLP